MSFKISRVTAREVIDSRGNPTVEVELAIQSGGIGRAIVPSGASTGIHEALELRDGNPNRFLGKGVLKAARNVEERIGPTILGHAFDSLKSLDEALLNLDRTPQKSSLGANAILGVSMAFAHAMSYSLKRPLYEVLGEAMGVSQAKMALPVPLMNIINGGLHASNGLEFQEFMIVPHGFDSFAESLRAGCEVFHHLKKILEKNGHSTDVGDEGGFAPRLESNERVISIILDAIERSGYQPRKEIALALDIAASSFASNGRYQVRLGEQTSQSTDQLIAYYEKLVSVYPIVSIEDGLGENDWLGWTKLTQRLGAQTQLVGDDIFVTQSRYLQKGIDTGAANAVLVKVNQVGSLTETFETMALAKKNGYRCVVSHRSGETEDTTIAHLAVASAAGQIKTGSLSRGERTAKYNELLRIESEAKRNGVILPFSRPFEK